MARKPAAIQRAPKRRRPVPTTNPSSVADSDGDTVGSNSALLDSDSDADSDDAPLATASNRRFRGTTRRRRGGNREERNREKLEANHPYMKTLWEDFEAIAAVDPPMAEQPTTISRRLKPFQLQGLAWMKAMEKTDWKGGLLGDEMGLGKTIQAVSLVMSDWPAKYPSLVLAPPVALMQWMSEINSYTDGTLKTMVYHGSNAQTKNITLKELKKFDVIIMSYNSLESLYRKQEKGFNRKDGIYKEKSPIHQLQFHRVILDEAHYIKVSNP
jgi:DNA repair protein RAD16